jgi:raffinose/stachyose/melibiose transport system substrate-binding protein
VICVDDPARVLGVNRRRATYLLAMLAALLSAAPATARGAVDLGATTVELEFPTFWVDGHPLAAPLAELVQQFNADNAGRAVVEIVPLPGADPYAERTLALLASGTVPDLLTLRADAAHLAYQDGDLLLDLTDEMASSWGDVFLPGAVADATRRGRTKSVPFEYAVAPIWFNESLFKLAGISSFPRTIADLWLAMQRLRAVGKVPAAQAGAGATSMLWFSHLAVSLGGREVWQRPLDDPLFAQAATALQRMYRLGNTGPAALAASSAAARAGYHTGATGITVDDASGVPVIREAAPAVHAATRLAYAPQVGDAHGFLLGVPLSRLAARNTAEPRERAAAVSFLRWLTLPANLLLLTEKSGVMFPVRYPAIRNVDPLLQEFIRITRDATFVALPLATAIPAAGGSRFAEALGALVGGDGSPALFMQALTAGAP